jgi:hypothetical protein
VSTWGRRTGDGDLAANTLSPPFDACGHRSPLAEKLRLAFIGTDYAPKGRGRKTVEPLAAEAGIAAQVTEQTDRVAYFVALQSMRVADFVLMIGSDDAQYTASKAAPCPGLTAADRRNSARRQSRRRAAGSSRRTPLS